MGLLKQSTKGEDSGDAIADITAPAPATVCVGDTELQVPGIAHYLVKYLF